MNIEAGLTSEALRNLTGANSKVDYHKDTLKLWEFVKLGVDKNFILTSGSKANDGGKEVKEKTGIVSGHAYAILDAKEIKTGDGKTH